MLYLVLSSRASRLLATIPILLSTIGLAFLAELAQAEEDVLSRPIQAGETLFQIAAEVGMDVPSLAAYNGIDNPDLLPVGLVLKLPPPRPRFHSVVPGDTLTAIAGRYGLEVRSLTALNDLHDPDWLPAGLRLRLPPSTEATTVAAQTPSPNGRAPRSEQPRRTIKVPYKVQPGDTLTSIAHAFNTSVADLTSDNGLENPNHLVAGETILVPAHAIGHPVVEGETLAALAARYKTDLGSLVDFNSLQDPNLLRPGDIILIPSATTTSAPVQPGPDALAAATPAPVAPTPVAATPAGAVPAPPSSPSPLPVPAPPSGPLSAQLVARVHALLGKPYAWGGSDPATGFDCSGLVWYVLRQAGRPASRGLFGQYQAGPNLAQAQLQPGDLVFFQNTYMAGLSHNGIYVGEGKFAHAVDEGKGVTISRIDDEYWGPRWFGATRIV